MKSKLIDILKSLSTEEFREFEKWLNSPWANSNKNLIKLIGKLKKYHPTYKHRVLSREHLSKQVLSPGKVNINWINNLLSQGFLQAQQFLVFQRLRKDDSLRGRLLQDELLERELEIQFFANAKLEQKKFLQEDSKSWEDYLEFFQLNRQVYHFPNQNVRMNEGEGYIRNMNQSLDIIFLLEKAALINEMIVRQRMIKGEKHELKKSLEIWKSMAEEVDHPSVNLFKIRFDYREGTLYATYKKLYNLFLSSFDQLNLKDQKVHLISLLNDRIYVSKEKRPEFSESLPLYKLGLKTEAILNKGKISRASYIHIISASNYIGDFDYSEAFIKNYHIKLPKEIQEDGYFWGKAHTLYRKGETKDAFNILVLRDFKSKQFQEISRVLNLQICFDLYLEDKSYEKTFHSLANAFEKWLKRQHNSPALLVSSFSKFIQKIRILANAYYQPNFDFKKLDKFLDSSERIQAFKWLESRKEFVVKQKGL